MPRSSRIALAFFIAVAGVHAQNKFPTVTILSTPAPATVATGQKVRLNVAVVDSNGYPLATGGTVQIFDGLSTLGDAVPAPDGTASFNISLAAGSHNLKAQFSGDAGVAASTSTVIVQTVLPDACPQLVFSQSPASVAAGANLGTVTVQLVCGAGVSTVNLTAMGLGGFKTGSVTSAPVVNGSATFSNLALTTAGAYTLAATAAGAAGAISNVFTVAPTGPLPVFTVVNTQDDGPGSFRDAFNQANLRGGYVTFQAGLSGTIPLASPLQQLISDVGIIGPGPRVLAVSGSKLTRVFFIVAGNFTLSGLTISDGVGGSVVADAFGAGIENLSSSQVSIDNCTLTNNVSPIGVSFGGAIYNTGKLSITNSTVSYNKAGTGGGIDNTGSVTLNNVLMLGNVSGLPTGGAGAIMNEEGASLTITNSTIYGNTAAESGGAFVNLGSLSISDSTLVHNEAHGSDSAGGVLLNQVGGLASIARSTLSFNTSARDGGAISNSSQGSVTIVNSTFVSNTASGNGGALANNATASASVTDSTIYGNGSLLGGGIYNEGNGSQLTLKNSIVAANINSLSSTPDDCVGCGSASTTNLIGGDPKLGVLQDNGGPTATMLPLPGSPALGAGVGSSTITTDQRGQPRPASGSVDYGAVQTNYTLSFATQPKDTLLGSVIPAAVQLQEGGRPFLPAGNLPPGSKTSPSITATLTLASGTGKLTGNVVTVDSASGLASFPALQVDTVGSKTLRASVNGFPSLNSLPFTVSTVPIVPTSMSPTAGNGQTTTVNTDFPTLLQIVVHDASGAGISGLSVIFTAVSGAAFGGGSSTTVAITDASGTATATTLTAGGTPGPAVVTVSLVGYSLQVTFNLTVTPNPAAPAITAAGFLNDASFLATAAAPNTIMAAFGTFPCGNSVILRVNGAAAEILSASTGQVNFTMPGTLAGNTPASVQAACGTLVSQTIQLQAAFSAPGIFTLTQAGKGQAAALNQTGVLNSAISPASAGEVIVLYVTGLGPFNPAGADGLQHMSLPIQALLGGTQATVLYAGAAPGYTPGLQQVNVLVPQGVSGLGTALTLTAGGISSQPGVTVAIR